MIHSKSDKRTVVKRVMRETEIVLVIGEHRKSYAK